jgi:hypothetical protein
MQLAPGQAGAGQRREVGTDPEGGGLPEARPVPGRLDDEGGQQRQRQRQRTVGELAGE